MSCARCYYFRSVAGAPHCYNRAKKIRWNPLMFFCTDYAATQTGENEIPFCTTLDYWL